MIAHGFAASACRHRHGGGRAIERLFAGTLPSSRLSALFEHVRACGECERYYRWLLRAERVLVHGQPSSPTVFEDERLEARIFDRLEAATAAAPPRRWWQAQGLQLGKLGHAAWVALALAVLLVVAASALRHGPPPGSHQEMTAKGGQPPAPVSLRLLRLRPPEGGRPARLLPAASDPRAPDGVLRLDDDLLVVYGNRSSARRFGFVLGVGADLRPRWYHPAPPATEGPPLAGNVSNKPLGEPIRLAVNHRRGPLVVLLLVSERPITRAEVDRALARCRSGGGKLADLDRLPLGADIQQRALRLRID